MNVCFESQSLRQLGHEVCNYVGTDGFHTGRRAAEDEAVTTKLDTEVISEVLHGGAMATKHLDPDFVKTQTPYLMLLRCFLAPAATLHFVYGPSDRQ